MPTGAVVFCTGSRCSPLSAPELIAGSAGGAATPGARGCVGVHWTNCSPSSDSSPISQWASARNGTNLGALIWSTSAAWFCWVSCTADTVPTLTPAILTSSPGIMNEELSNTARTT